MKKYILLLALTTIVSCCMAQKSDSVLMKKADAFFFDNKEYSKAYPIYRQLADKGNARAQRFVGYYFHYGLETQEIDYQEALKWYSLAADKGDDIAQAKLGDAYFVGDLGQDINYAKAFEWYKKSAAGGYDEAMIQLGIMYEEGHYVQQNIDKARDYYLQALNKTGNVRAMLALGDLYQYQSDEEDNMDRAAEWYKRAADNGNPEGLRALAILYDRDNMLGLGLTNQVNRTYVENLWMDAAQKGSGMAQAVAGFKCFTDNKFDEALQWYEKAKQQGVKRVFRFNNINLPIDIAIMLCNYFKTNRESNFYCIDYASVYGDFDGWRIIVFPSEHSNIPTYIPSDYITVAVVKDGKYGLVKLSTEGKLLGKSPVIYDGDGPYTFYKDNISEDIKGKINGKEVVIKL